MKKFRKTVVTILIGLIILSVPIAMHTIVSTLGNDVVRIGGATRYDTSVLVADALKSEKGIEKFDTIILASGKNFPDALAGSYLANRKQAPVIMVGGNSTAYLTYIQQNLAPNGTVYLLGGEVAISAAVERQLAGYNVKRLSGATRYETNLAILKEAGVTSGDLLVCTGYSFADALAASAVDKPILLVNSNTRKLSEEQKAFLDSINVENIYIIGGTTAVSKRFETALSNYGNVERVQGRNRYETSVAIARTFFSNPQTAILTYSHNFPDGLSGGPLAVAMGAPLLLTRTGSAPTAEEYVWESGITDGFVLGGTAIISDHTVRTIFSISEPNYKIGSWTSEKE